MQLEHGGAAFPSDGSAGAGGAAPWCGHWPEASVLVLKGSSSGLLEHPPSRAEGSPRGNEPGETRIEDPVFNDQVSEVTPSFPLILFVQSESRPLACSQGEKTCFPPLKMPARFAHVEMPFVKFGDGVQLRNHYQGHNRAPTTLRAPRVPSRSAGSPPPRHQATPICFLSLLITPACPGP